MQPTPYVPDVRELYLPLLACLPTAFVSPRPPPALLPLLSPILRQRVHFQTADQPATIAQTQGLNSDSAWLKLLTWSPSRANNLNDVVSNLQLEPHPVSGEIELFGDDVDGTSGKPLFRRLDEEVLQAAVSDHEHGLAVIWVWCTNDTGGIGFENTVDGHAQDGWRVAEVLSVEDWPSEQTPAWHPSIPEAEATAMKDLHVGSAAAPAQSHSSTVNGRNTDTKASEEDDDYWAMYDRTPGRTPAAKPSPFTTNGLSKGNSAAEEDEYFSRYANVQPAMDAHDPDEEQTASGLETTLGDQTLSQPSERHGRELLNNSMNIDPFVAPIPSTSAKDDTLCPADAVRIHSPIPSRPSSPRADSPQSDTVAKLEARARSMSTASASAEIGVKQHVSSEIKSLFRLCKGVGIDREEFERMIKREVDVLAMLDDEI